jgi:hypothetical protein
VRRIIQKYAAMFAAEATSTLSRERDLTFKTAKSASSLDRVGVIYARERETVNRGENCYNIVFLAHLNFMK